MNKATTSAILFLTCFGLLAAVEEADAQLRRRGCRSVRYLDGGTTGCGKCTVNFDDETGEIEMLRLCANPLCTCPADPFPPGPVVGEEEMSCYSLNGFANENARLARNQSERDEKYKEVFQLISGHSFLFNLSYLNGGVRSIKPWNGDFSKVLYKSISYNTGEFVEELTCDGDCRVGRVFQFRYYNGSRWVTSRVSVPDGQERVVRFGYWKLKIVNDF